MYSLKTRFIFFILVALSFNSYSNQADIKYPVVAEPANILDIISLVNTAKDNEQRIKVVGSQLSHSDVAESSDILMKSSNLSGVLPIDFARLKVSNTKNLVRILSGTKISFLNDYFDKNNMAFGILGGYDGQTFVGAAMTATHGSSLNYGPLSDAIKSIQLVGENGHVYQIEPHKGITDPNAFPGVLEEDPSVPVTLIQDDDTFYAMKVNIGAMGIIYSVIFQAEKEFWLKEQRIVMSWDEFKQPHGYLDKIIAKSQNRNNRLETEGKDPTYYEFQVSPYPKNDGSHSVLLTKRWKYYYNIGEDDPKSRGQIFNYLGSLILRHTQSIVAILMNFFPETAVNTIEKTIQIQADDDFRNKGYNVFNIGIPNQIKVKTIELSFDIKDTVVVIEQFFQTADELRKKKMMVSVPLSGRFVKSSNSLIAMQNGRDSLMVELTILNGIKEQEKSLEQFEDIFIKEFKARPHWGLSTTNIKGDHSLREVYPKWDLWLSIYHQFNFGTFDSSTTDRLGISVKPR